MFVCWTSGLLLPQGQAQAQARPVVVTTFPLGRGHHPSSLCVLCHVKGSKPLLRQVCVTVLSPGSWCSVAARASVLSPERVCSTLKDLGRRNRTWRNGLKRWSSISPQSIFAHTPLRFKRDYNTFYLIRGVETRRQKSVLKIIRLANCAIRAYHSRSSVIGKTAAAGTPHRRNTKRNP